MARILDSGIIYDFAIDGIKNEIFPKLPEKADITYGLATTTFDYFGVFYNKSMYYLSCNPNIDVTEQYMDSPKLYQRRISNTKIPNLHFGLKVEGLRIGNFFWIMGGTSQWEDFQGLDITSKTSLWVINRKIWIHGPILPQIIYHCK